MNLRNNIDELLNEVRSLMLKIECDYESAKNNEEMVSINKVTVKSAMEHLRSCLDYCANDLQKYLKVAKPIKIYFPHGENKIKFDKSINQNFPSLRATNNNLFNLIENIQPHKNNSMWLFHLCSLTNENKHNGLTEQVRANSQENITQIENFIQVENCGAVVFHNCVINNTPVGYDEPFVISADIPIKTLNEQTSNQLRITRRYKKVSFEQMNGIDTLELIKTSHKQITTFTTNLYSVIGK